MIYSSSVFLGWPKVDMYKLNAKNEFGIEIQALYQNDSLHSSVQDLLWPFPNDINFSE